VVALEKSGGLTAIKLVGVWTAQSPATDNIHQYRILIFSSVLITISHEITAAANFNDHIY